MLEINLHICMLYTHTIGLGLIPLAWGNLSNLCYPSQDTIEYFTKICTFKTTWGTLIHFLCPSNVYCNVYPHYIWLWLGTLYWWHGSIKYSFTSMYFHFMAWVHSVLCWRPCFDISYIEHGYVYHGYHSYDWLTIYCRHSIVPWSSTPSLCYDDWCSIVTFFGHKFIF